jgi:hypothetical protein
MHFIQAEEEEEKANHQNTTNYIQTTPWTAIVVVAHTLCPCKAPEMTPSKHSTNRNPSVIVPSPK